VALKQDGTVAAWGDNSSGQCDLPSYLTGVTAIAAGGQHTVALKQDGTVTVWGANNYKQCDVPSHLTGVVAIAAGASHTVALKQDGTVAAWGMCNYKQCDVPINLTGVVAIAAGMSHTVALKQDGTLAAWGWNGFRQCDVPINLTGVVAIAARGNTTTALIFQQPDVMATDLALRFFKLGCALLSAADGQFSSKEQHWLELHLGQGSDAEIMSLITQHGPDGIQQELQKIAANLSKAEKSWLHCGAWQFGDLAGADGLADEENAAIAFILNACGWYQLPEWLQAQLWQA
jgi:alpha-tubulin suppressor-like RCC1 family protein